MKAKLIGVMDIDFSNANGEIKGTNIYVAFNDSNVQGMRTEKFFIKKEIPIPEVKINETVTLFFTHKGKVEAIEKA